MTADQCPRITKAFLEDERRSLPAWIFDQEYMCVFGDSVDAVFRYQDIAGMLSDEVTPLFGSADVHPFISSELFPRP